MPVVVTVATNGGLDLRWATLYNLLANATIQDGATSTELPSSRANSHNDANVRFVVAGNGFTFSGTFPAIEPTGGTVEGITIQTEAGITLATFAGFAIDAATLAAALDTYTAGGPGTLYLLLSTPSSGSSPTTPPGVGAMIPLKAATSPITLSAPRAMALPSAVPVRTPSTEGRGPSTVPPTSPLRSA